MKTIAVILLFSFNLAHAKIYKCKQTNGTTNYSETPCPKSQKSEQIQNFKQVEEGGKSSDEGKSIMKFGVPFYPGAVITSNDTMDSSESNKGIRDISYDLYVDPEIVLNFYRSHSAIKKCEKNDMADNYMCKFNKTDKVSGGDLFIDSIKKKGKIEVYMSYFYFK